MTQDGYASGKLTGGERRPGRHADGYVLQRPDPPRGQGGPGPLYQPARAGPNGNNNWVQTNDSGPVLYGSAGSGSLARSTGAALEESNVDLTAELVGMMTAQRSYQANAQTIKTQDQVFSTLVNLR